METSYAWQQGSATQREVGERELLQYAGDVGGVRTQSRVDGPPETCREGEERVKIKMIAKNPNECYLILVIMESPTI